MGKTEQMKAGLLKSVKMRGYRDALGLRVRCSNGRISPGDGDIIRMAGNRVSAHRDDSADPVP